MKMNNRDKQFKLTINNIENIKSKFFLYGFILGITPFILLIGIMSINKGGLQYVPALFKRTLILFGIIFSMINAFISRYMISKRLSEYFDYEYDDN